MAYNVEYDHGNIAKNHNTPNVIFMVDHSVTVKDFNKNQYEEALNYQQSQLSKVSQVVDENGEPLKSAISNTGEFSTTNNDIRYRRVNRGSNTAINRAKGRSVATSFISFRGS